MNLQLTEEEESIFMHTQKNNQLQFKYSPWNYLWICDMALCVCDFDVQITGEPIEIALISISMVSKRNEAKDFYAFDIKLWCDAL